ncbi:uncharacterized protein J3R85_010661 [Psidium guajava]|nr:uncharacterized protein J3R85_010661 [Psidium guajava]
MTSCCCSNEVLSTDIDKQHFGGLRAMSTAGFDFERILNFLCLTLSVRSFVYVLWFVSFIESMIKDNVRGSV